MAMFSFDEQAALFDVTPLPNQFILNYLPEASGDAVRVYLFGLVATGIGEALVMYVLGLPLLSALKRFHVVKQPAKAS